MKLLALHSCFQLSHLPHLRSVYILNDLFVLENYRNQGISKLLIHRVIEFAKEKRIQIKRQITNLYRSHQVSGFIA